MGVFFACRFAQALQPIVDPAQRFPCFFHSVPGEIELSAIIYADQRVTDFATGVTFRKDVGDRVKVAQRFRHLLTVDQQMRAVQPVAHKPFSSHAFALGNLRFVVRKNVVHAAAVDVDLIAEERGRHRAALDVPAGPPQSPWRIPFHIGIFFVPRFPKREVANVFFIVLVVLYATGRLQLIQIEVCQFSVIWKFVDPKINRFVVGLVGETFRDQLADHRDHFIDVTLIGRGRIIVRAFDPQRFRILEECVLEFLRKLLEGNASFARAADRFVIDIGDVHHAMNFVVARFEMTLEQVFENVGAEVSDVRAAINRGPTRVDVDLVRRSDGLVLWRAILCVTRPKFFELA